MLIVVSTGTRSGRTRLIMMISSSEALPARSPMPLIVHSTCRAPAPMAAMRVRHGQPQVIVAMRAEDRAVRVGHPSDHGPEEVGDLIRRRVADRVRQVDRPGAGGDDRLDQPAQKIEVASGRVLGGELDVVGAGARAGHGGHGGGEAGLAGHPELALEVEIRRRDERVDAAAARRGNCPCGPVDVTRRAPRQRRDDGTLEGERHAPDRFGVGL